MKCLEGTLGGILLGTLLTTGGGITWAGTTAPGGLLAAPATIAPGRTLTGTWLMTTGAWLIMTPGKGGFGTTISAWIGSRGGGFSILPSC